MRRRFTPEDDEAQIDLTPMLDVVFIMLIFFIVTASFVREFGINVTRPEPGPQQQQKENKNILVSIDGANRIYINRQLVDVGSVLPRIKQLYATVDPDAAVVISASEGAKVDTYSRVHEAAQLAGVRNIVLATQS
ncbi:MAG: biopolymer transporter ExbD [Alphaproteobacteria bacterium]|nr:MAG: biopolymer transporter ExbD [Alphaproteobacteria bacterium]